MRDEVGATVERRCFRTRARTVDHLGREQIADAPTAISELWKNSWDAYARSVELTIFDGSIPAAVLTDDGHGMSEEDFYDRWLVVGTESKFLGNKVSTEERNGMPVRPRQGRKGIGRLSVAKLGSVLFLLTRRRNQRLFAALIDWRLFENPYIDIDDVPVASGSFSTLQESLIAIPNMIEVLVSSVISPRSKNWRNGEYFVNSDWEKFDGDITPNSESELDLTPSGNILEFYRNFTIDENHFRDWYGQGTALFISDVDDGLRLLISPDDNEPATLASTKRIKSTLSNFVDTYGQPDDTPSFYYCVKIVKLDDIEERYPKLIVEAGKGIDRARVANLEHQIEGTVDENGVFIGRVRTFGQWNEDVVRFNPPADLKIPKRGDSRVGKFKIFLATMELDYSSSTHSQAEHSLFKELAKENAGMLIFRDGMRVLPYGREDNDFFEIEKRRSKHAGRNFWSHRGMFGRIAITSEENSNLKDKAGREGFLENTASRAFREIVINILELSAKRYFGTDSPERKNKLNEIDKENMNSQANKHENRFREREFRAIRNEIRIAEKNLPKLLNDIDDAAEEINLKNDQDVIEVSKKLSNWKSQFNEYSVRSLEPVQPVLKKKYSEAKKTSEVVAEAIHDFELKFNNAVCTYQPRESKKAIALRADAALHSMCEWIDNLSKDAETLLQKQLSTVQDLANERNKEFKDELEAIVWRHTSGEIDFGRTLEFISNAETQWRAESHAFFNLYISASAAVQERIDIEMLASSQMRQVTEANREVERLNALAQLGIAVEISAHDLADYDALLKRSLDLLPDEVRGSDVGTDLQLGVEGLTSHLHFLAPLRLSGNEFQREITGNQVGEFISRFFSREFKKRSIRFEITDAFREFHINEKRTRIFPVFLNIVNNAIYWVSTLPPDGRRISIDFNGKSVVVSDSGPGVEPEDIPRIFDLFFTRKQRSGRGVGLYLAQSNLAAGGHTIHYKKDGDQALLDGAAFYVTFHNWDELKK